MDMTALHEIIDLRIEWMLAEDLEELGSVAFYWDEEKITRAVEKEHLTQNG